MSDIYIIDAEDVGPYVVDQDDDTYLLVEDDDATVDELEGRGADAKVAIGFDAPGPFTARQRIVTLVISGSGTLTAAASHAFAESGLAGANTWDVTRGGAFADPNHATELEIAAAHFATIAFPAGAPAWAVWTYLGLTPGLIADKDKIRVWESAVPDPTQANTAVTFAGS